MRPLSEEPGFVGVIHRRTDAALGFGLRPKEASVVRGMVLGDRSLIPEELDQAFRRSGITHVLVSPTPESSSPKMPVSVSSRSGGGPAVSFSRSSL